jgi:hypothetical protein
MVRSRFRLSAVATATAAIMFSTATVATPARAASPGPPPQASSFDHVLYWNGVLLDAFRRVRKQDAAPTLLARAGAMLHIAMHDANWPAAPVTYLPKIKQQHPDDSIEATMDAAAHRVLTEVFRNAEVEGGSRGIDFGPNLAYALGQIPSRVPRQYVDGGKADGVKIGDLMIAARAGDGPAMDPSYVEGTVPGAWRQTGSGAPVSPNWWKLKPFAMTSSTQFRPDTPGGFDSYDELIRSSEYAAQVKEVRDYGGSAGPTSRTADQTQAAFFWANDVDGTYKPVGQLYAITADISRQKGLKQNETAELFNLVSMALADASIVAWGAKYESAIDLWRPESAINLAPASPDPNWEPLSVDRAGNRFSPPFPAYVSGHATFGAAWAGVMQRWFGHGFAFTAGTEDPNANPKTRSFPSFEAAAVENALSRIWLGVHYRWDADAGLEAGFNLGDFVYVTRRDQ